MTKTYAKMKFVAADKIDAEITGIERRASKLQDDIHRIGVSILYHWQMGSAAKKISDDDALIAAHTAVLALNKLQAASPYHANSFSKWVAEFTPLLWSEEIKTWYASPSDCRMMGERFVAAREMPFFKLKPAAVPQPFDMGAALEKLIKTAEKRMDNPKEGDVIKPEALKFLREARDLFKV